MTDDYTMEITNLTENRIEKIENRPISTAKTKQLGYHDQETEEELAQQAWEVENGLSSRADLAVALVALSVSHRRGSRLVDSAREGKKSARSG